MPYIKQERRGDLTPISNRVAISAGELNFQITKLVNQYLYHYAPGKSYEGYNTVVGALECAKLEIYRRMISAYEDKKLIENGDVYWS